MDYEEYDDKKAKKMEFVNINAPLLLIPHMELSRYGDSMYKSVCPVCEFGLLLVHRDSKTFILQEHDHCLLCGQRVKYTDIIDLRKREGLE